MSTISDAFLKAEEVEHEETDRLRTNEEIVLSHLPKEFFMIDVQIPCAECNHDVDINDAEISPLDQSFICAECLKENYAYDMS